MFRSHLIQWVKGAFAINKTPFPLSRALCAGICSATPTLIGILFNHFSYGLMASIGGFAYLYVWNEPYLQRAKKIFLVAASFSVLMMLGVLTSSSTILFSLLIGLVGALVTFIFGALKIPGPASIFFVMIFSMSSATHPDPHLAWLYGGLVMLGGIFSWIVAMIGWFWHPYGPETKAVHAVYTEIARLIDKVGTDQFDLACEKTVQILNNADTVLLAGYSPWHSSLSYKRLYLLNNQANLIFSDILELVADGYTKLPKEVGQSVKALADLIDNPSSGVKTILQPKETTQKISALLSKIYDADAILNKTLKNINAELNISKPSAFKSLSHALDKDSIVFTNSIKYGFVLIIAALIAFSFDFQRSYWIPASCAAVMMGSTIISTFHRAIQRSLGTILGVLIASVILYNQPTGILVALCSLVFSFFTELFIVKNYAFAVIFLTPNSILIAENTTQINNLSFFATTRVTDIIIGAIIGLIGVLLIGRRTASSRLPNIIAKTIRSQSELLFNLFSAQTQYSATDRTNKMSKMQINMTNLRTVYTTALGELPSNKTLDFLWPAIASLEQLSFHLSSLNQTSQSVVLEEENLSKLLYLFESMAKNMEQQQITAKNNAPLIKGYGKIKKEILNLQDALNLYQTRVTNQT